MLDLTRALSGPAAVRQLADWGADVIQIEVPSKEAEPPDQFGPRHGAYFQNLHRNKRGLTIDLRKPQGRELLYRLVGGADVLVENYRPSVKHRLKIDYDTLREINPRLVYSSISGYGQDGPYAARPAFDQIIQGMGGLMAVTGFPGGGPVRAGLAVSDMASGLYLAFGILAALHEREVTGRGRWVQTSLLEAMIAMMDFQAARWLCEGIVPQQVGNDHPINFPMSAFETADSAINIAPVEQAMWVKLCEVIERTDLIERPEFATDTLRAENKSLLRPEMAAAFKRQTSAHWIEKLNAAGVPCGPIYSMDEVFGDPQVAHLGMSQRVMHPEAGELHLVGQPVRFGGEPRPAFRPTPARGEHTEAILAEAGLSAGEIAALRSAEVI